MERIELRRDKGLNIYFSPAPVPSLFVFIAISFSLSLYFFLSIFVALHVFLLFFLFPCFSACLFRSRSLPLLPLTIKNKWQTVCSSALPTFSTGFIVAWLVITLYSHTFFFPTHFSSSQKSNIPQSSKIMNNLRIVNNPLSPTLCIIQIFRHK